MVMKNFEVEFVFTCPCFLGIVLLAISGSKKNERTIHISDFIFVRNGKDICAAETFGSDKSFLFSCGKLVVECFFFDVNICNHYNKRSFFTYWISISDLPQKNGIIVTGDPSKNY